MPDMTREPLTRARIEELLRKKRLGGANGLCSDAEFEALCDMALMAVVPSGWRLTPHEPTQEMMKDGNEQQWDRLGTTKDIWQSMWHAVPDAPNE